MDFLLEDTKKLEFHTGDYVYDFFEAVRRADVFCCFGIGSRFDLFRSFFSKYDFIKEKLLCCIDNNENKQGSYTSFDDKEIPVLSLMNLADKYYGKKIVVLITVAKCNDITLQLQSLEKNINFHVYFSTELISDYTEEDSLKHKLPKNIRLSPVMKIPKTIHYCWFGNKAIPDQYKLYMDSWKRYCPDYEIVRWDESNYDVHGNKYLHDAYINKKWAFVSDYARLDVVYRYGGIYLDTDVELLKSMDNLLYQDGFIGFENSIYVNSGLGLGSVKNLSIIKELRDDYDKIKFDIKNLSLITCPKLQTELLKSKGLKQDGSYQIIDDLSVLPVKTLSPMNLFSKEINLTNDSYAIHHYAGSWL